MSSLTPSMHWSKVYAKLEAGAFDESLRNTPVLIADDCASVKAGQTLGPAQSVEKDEVVLPAAALHSELHRLSGKGEDVDSLEFCGKLVDGLVVTCEPPEQQAARLIPQPISTGGAVVLNYFLCSPRCAPLPPDDGTVYIYAAVRKVVRMEAAGGGGSATTVSLCLRCSSAMVSSHQARRRHRSTNTMDRLVPRDAVNRLFGESLRIYVHSRVRYRSRYTYNLSQLVAKCRVQSNGSFFIAFS